jgi:hypothetical protein
MLSEKDRHRLKVLNEVQQEHVTQKKAGEQLQVSDRWIRSLLSRVREEGDGAGSAEVRVFCVPLRLFLAIPSYPSPFIGGQQHAIHRQPARRGDRALNAARVIVHARPRPLLRPAYQPCPHGIPMDILYLCVVLLHGAQSTIKACPERVEGKRGCHSLPVSRREWLIRLVAPSLMASITHDIVSRWRG